MTCPHCKNEDPQLLELIKILDHVFPVVYKYLCSCCSKTFYQEYRDNSVRQEGI